MSSSPSTIQFLQEQMEHQCSIRSRMMMGEYMFYADDKPFAIVAGDQLFIKITEAGKAFMGGEPATGEPYPGAKPYLTIDADRWDDADFMSELAKITADALPTPKPKNKLS